MTYIIFSATSIHSLIEKVNEAYTIGFHVSGGITYDGQQYHQPMVKQ